MPKAANAPLKPVHVPNPRPVKVVPIKHPDRQNGPHHTGLSSTASNKLAAEAVRIAGSPGGINPKQQVN